MVGFDIRQKNLTHYDIMFAGAASGFITRATCQPLDVLKIRFQLQVEPISKTVRSKYHSMPQAVRLICKEEGIKALWKGHIPAQFLSVVYGLVQFWTFEVLTKQAHLTNLNVSFKPLVNFSCGAIAGCSATVASFPFDVVRTRLVAQSERNKLYLSVTGAFKHIIKNESVLVLYKGLLPTFIQVAPHAGVQFMCYKIFDGFYRSLVNIDNSVFTLPGSVVSGSLAGLVAKASIYPLDLVKKRMQIQGVEHHRREFGTVFVCKGMIDCFIKMYHTEGILGLFKGLNPSLVKAVVTTAIHFSSYECVCKIISDIRS
ncbi:hypothetical protein ILUMI_25169 [Ignelater luminosus]|uniref:Mitochondrial thiamine pyrophosphate carrier n=1 Tax=Ignelater luminosus TaxID=2038154 RepID=A0A8K0C944_IGNLU|nr:hypothetical protein ILUMI_25169 [Ignelater luminosus]